jgi:N-methylhydantoinase B
MDPITMSVIGHSMVSIAEEMGVNLYQAAHCTAIREMRDIGTALFDAEGHTVALANWVPMLMNAMEPASQRINQDYPIAELKPGEALLTNDPFHGGQHVNDIVLFTPIHHQGRLIGLACANAHHVDVGGGAPGTNARATEVFQEGIVFPPLKIDLRGDWRKTTFGRIFANNIRAPDKTLNDFDAQIGACRTGERRVLALVEKYGVDTVLEFMREIQDYSERLTRAAIAEVPDGDYGGEAFMEDDGSGAERNYRFRVTVRVRGSDMEIDFTGTDPQAEGFINIPLASTHCCVRTTITSILRMPARFVNGGTFRPVKITAPLGTLVNPRRPAATQARTSSAYKVFDSILMALALVLPDKVAAPGFDSQTGITFTLRRPGREASIFSEVMGGGNGGLAFQDGADGMIMHLTNGTNTPVEVVEIEHPFLEIGHYGLVDDSGGAGRFRGGLGMTRSFRILEEDVVFGLHSDRHRHSAPGLFGGGSGWTGECALERNGERTVLGSKVDTRLQKGDVVTIRTGGGAGYGPPAERDPRLIEKDLRERRMSEPAVLRDYGRLPEGRAGEG